MNNKETMETIEIKDIIEVEQPIGRYYIAKINAKQLLKISCADERLFNEELEDYIGTQRHLESRKLTSLKEYIKTSDATFPSAIIGTLVGDNYYIEENENRKKIVINLDVNDTNNRPFKIIDGQHRLYSFKDEDVEQFDLIVSIFLDASVNDQAYIFSVINTTQTKLNPSLLQDLTSLSKVATPEQVINSITRKFNNDENSPLYKKIKMLGKKDKTSPNGIISQYTFSKPLINCIYNPKEIRKLRELLINNGNNRRELPKNMYNSNKHIFWKYYINIEQKLIYQMLYSYFSAMSTIFSEAWGNPSYILCKTTGYTAFMKLFSDFYRDANGNETILVNENHYKKVFNTIKSKINFLESEYRLGESGIQALYMKLKEIYTNTET